jgi:hypothetical protein
VQATASSGSDGGFSIDVRVALDNGEVFALDRGGGSGGGDAGERGGGAYVGGASSAVIDVESATMDIDKDDVIDV